MYAQCSDVSMKIDGTNTVLLANGSESIRPARVLIVTLAFRGRAHC